MGAGRGNKNHLRPSYKLRRLDGRPTRRFFSPAEAGGRAASGDLRSRRQIPSSPPWPLPLLSVVPSGPRMEALALRCVSWCRRELEIPRTVTVLVTVETLPDHWGLCFRRGSAVYHLLVHREQSAEDFVETVAHEMVRVKRCVSGARQGDGEEEATQRATELCSSFFEESTSPGRVLRLPRLDGCTAAARA